MRRVLLHIVAPVAFALVVEAVARGTLVGALLSFAYSRPSEFAASALFFMLLLLVLLGLPRPLPAMVIVAGAFLALAGVSSQKMHYLAEPLFPWDFLSAWQMMHLVPTLVADRVSAGALLVSVAVAGISLRIIQRLRLWRRLAAWLPQSGIDRWAAIPALLLVLACVYLVSPRGREILANTAGIHHNLSNQSDHYDKNGFLLAFGFNLNSALVEPARIAELDFKQRVDGNAGAARPLPDIVVWMSESFWDPSRLPNVAISPDPMPTVRRHQVGTVFSPQWAGGTANVEFEVMTGFSNAFLPESSLPYQQYIKRAQPSVPRALKAHGYRTIALHPYKRQFWNRDRVYAHLGFDEFLAEGEGVLAKAERRGPFVGDLALTDAVIATVEQQTTPTFLFAVSMQNHGPYSHARYPDRVTVSGKLSEAERQMISTYATGIADADDGFARLIDWARNRKRRTVVIFFGDHLPFLGPNFGLYAATGLVKRVAQLYGNDLERLNADDYSALRETPLAVFANFHVEPQPGEARTSPSLLAHHIIAKAGIDHPFYSRLLGDVARTYSVIDRRVIQRVTGSTQPEQQSSLLDVYQSIQYRAMFEDGKGVEQVFPELWSPAHPPLRSAPFDR